MKNVDNFFDYNYEIDLSYVINELSTCFSYSLY